MTRSIRLCIAWCQHQLDLLDRVLERREARQRQSQSRYDQCVGIGLAPYNGGQYANGSLNFCNAGIVSQSGYAVEKDHGGFGSADYLRNVFGGVVGCVGHDGKFCLFKWDDEQGCYVPLEESRAA